MKQLLPLTCLLVHKYSQSTGASASRKYPALQLLDVELGVLRPTKDTCVQLRQPAQSPPICTLMSVNKTIPENVCHH